MRIKDNEDLLILQIEFETYEEKEKVLTLINTMNTKIIGYKRDKKYFIQIESIYYIELIDKKTFIYTKEECYESPLWLYQIEEQLDQQFIRVNKSTILNMKYIKSLKADIGSRIIVYLDNQDQVLVSRTYAKEFKKRLGGE
ncbi:MAG: LytTR family DNA-binding domain-containing protein [Longibaculum muris]|uniref:LytTR family transcriptional regulator n=1 Tax=Longibaculum muris TaxID=1796628 RepID=A0A4R3Z9A3_9FIRM|nr:LytTR family DNA-binding domain-containing protein [Longibaculum muris]KXU40750.1 LytTr DNA-binding domain protein [Candidatus Stoquefichus sp. KLE1796]MCR1886954.1 LytTR family transcriptional regulator DNA-binding domain-containing protein [Longibaculum muris]MED9811594.1 LytTR family DNA-binding domain-containing protein [Longibaculum muris]TCW02985.1 LytTR family transcriptional regulator [Longibaculum muris]